MINAHQVILAACDTSQAPAQVCQHDSVGPGAGLRIFVVLAIVGIVLLAWLLLRGYGGGAQRRAGGDARPGQVGDRDNDNAGGR